MGDEGWHTFPEDAGFDARWIHETRRDKWMRRMTASGEWSYTGTSLVGASERPRVCVVKIDGKEYKRHRLMALACGKMSVEQFRDPSVVVMHLRRREEDAYPDDSPINLKIGTHADNRKDPRRKKVARHALGHSVRITCIATGSSKVFESTTVAARFLGVDGSHLRQYLNGGRVKTMPGPARGVWEAEYADAVDVPDAVELVGAAARLWLSPSRPNQVLRQLKTGMFVTTALKTGDGGYVRIGIGNGKLEMLHRLVIKTFRPGAFEKKLAENPGLTEADVDVDHIDGDESNNSIDNLRLVTKSEHARKHAQAVEWIGPDGEILGTFECCRDAAKAVQGTNGQQLVAGHIHRTCDGSLSHTGGRIFRWKDAEAVAAARAARIAKRTRRPWRPRAP